MQNGQSCGSTVSLYDKGENDELFHVPLSKYALIIHQRFFFVKRFSQLFEKNFKKVFRSAFFAFFTYFPTFSGIKRGAIGKRLTKIRLRGIIIPLKTVRNPPVLKQN